MPLLLRFLIAGIFRTKYDSPWVDAVSPLGSTGTVTVPKEKIYTKPVSGTYLDAVAGDLPFMYPSSSFGSNKALPRADSSGTETAQVWDTPSLRNYKFDSNTKRVGAVTVFYLYKIKELKIEQSFKTWAVAHNSTTNKTIPLLQKSWSLSVAWNWGAVLDVVSGGPNVSGSSSAPSGAAPVLDGTTANSYLNGLTDDESNGTAGNVTLSY